MLKSDANDSITYDNLNGISNQNTVNFIADRPKAALLFWFFGDFGCGVL